MDNISTTSNRSAHIYIVLLIVGFFFIGTVPKIFGIASESLSVPYRGFILLFSFYLIFKTIFSTRIKNISFSSILLFILFWFIYSIRIILDLYILPIHLFPDTSPSQYFIFAFGVTLIPAITTFLLVITIKFDFSWILRYTYFLIFITLLIALYSRSGSDLQGRDAGDVNVGIILFGHYGCSLALLSVYRYIKSNNTLSKIYYFIGFVIGFSGIFVSASKSPFLALLLILIIFFACWYQSFKSIYIIAFFGIIMSIFYVDILTLLGQYFNSNFVERLLYSIEIGGDDNRERLLKAAWQEFINSPFIGNAMLIQENGLTGSYPHNIIVEAFMATGFFGGVIFLFWIFKSGKISVKNITHRTEISWISLLFMQYLIFGMFSKNLYSNDLFWIFSLVVVGFSYKSNVFKIK